MMIINIASWKFTITKTRMALLLLALISVVIILFRFITGLGMVTNLSDESPWGFWISFDVLAGVALAGGGYSTALIAHVLHKDKYHAVSRSALLTSLLGYVIVMAGLFMDIGQWFNSWRPFVSWGTSSVLFEVFWCISIYTTIQVLEFGEIVTERVGTKFNKYFKKALPILLILGVIFPVLHQASLGGLFLVTAHKLSPLWWSTMIPLFFLMSSFFVGPAMICVESTLSGKAFNHKIPVDVLHGLARISGYTLIVYLALKVYDLMDRGALGLAFTGSLAANMFLIEIIVGILIPLGIIFSNVGTTRKGLFTYGLLVSAGVILNRLNIVFVGLARPDGGFYIPSIFEVIVSFGLVAIGCLAYCFIVENFRILDHEGNHEVEHEIDHRVEKNCETSV